ncbi:MAG: M50 family metallopeptidase [Elusimicrobia bacterium]|nr:M50 family metallopeptidase [Elusimicrobiota bacterium]
MPWKRLAGLAVVLAALWLLWRTPVVYPIRILVTFLHEGSHGLAAVLTGGSIDRITVEADGSGLCFTRGGWRWAVLPAGYLGSMFWGSVILILACRTRLDKYVASVLGWGLIAITLLYVRSWFGFGSGLALGLVLASAGRWLPEEVNDWLLTCIGSASCLCAIFDIRDLTRVAGETDATMFSREIIPLPPLVWTVLWGVLAVACLAVSLRIALAPARERPRGAFDRMPA